MAEPHEILERSQTVAVVGIARTTDKPSGDRCMGVETRRHDIRKP